MSAVLAVVMVACGGPEPSTSSFGVPPGQTTTAPESTGEAPETSSSSTSSTGLPAAGSSTRPTRTTGVESTTTPAVGTSEPSPDLGGPDFGDPHPVGCKGKIDFLFVISRLGYMEEMQQRLIEAFPQFIATIESKFADFDYHIMVVD